MNYIPKFTWDTHSAPDVFTFPGPPVGDHMAEKVSSDWDVLVANKGKRQVQYNHTEVIYDLQFTFLDEDDYEDLTDFYDEWGKLGNEFRYYPHSDEVDYFTVQLLNPDWKWDVITPTSTGNLRRLKIPLRRYYE